MKNLQTNFVGNFEKSGNNRFIQLRRDNRAAMYRRETMEGHLIGFEVFKVKTVLAGTPMQGGGIESEDREPYPRANSFGRTAWFIGGYGAEQRANERFNELSQGILKVEIPDEIETETITVVKVSKMRTERPKLNFPSEPFTQKELASFNHIDNYKEVYTDLQRFLATGVLRRGEKRESTRGKSAQLFEVVNATVPAELTV